MMIKNPAPSWGQRLLKKQRTTLEDYGPRLTDNILGCGHYGCVVETEDPDVVLKITSDPTEAEFVKYLSENDIEQPFGIVRYFNWKKVEGTYRGRDVYAIWREGVAKVGVFSINYRNDNRDINRLSSRIMLYAWYAGKIKKALDNSINPTKLWKDSKNLEDYYWRKVEWDSISRYDEYIRHLKGAHKIAYCWRACEIIAEFMENENLADSIGSAFGEFMDRGILLADVHLGNIGLAQPNKFRNYEAWVITDPGHSIIVDKL